MTKEITKARILQEIEDKFGLREFEAAKFLFSEEVTPVYNIETHLEKWVTNWSQKSITAGPAGYQFYAVPYDERWHLDAYNVVFMGAGAYTVTGVYISREAGEIVYLDMVAGQSISYAKLLYYPMTLNAGDQLAVYVDAYTSTQDLRLYINYRKEELR